MGVQNLWQLLEPAKAPLKNGASAQVENKRLAVDISIWITQLVKGMRDNRGEQIPNAHLIGLFSRIAQLLFLGVRPVFVFDGGTPTLKKQTTAMRQRQRDKGQRNLEEARERQLQNRLRRYALGDRTALSSRRLKRVTAAIAEETMFQLPTQDGQKSAESKDPQRWKSRSGRAGHGRPLGSRTASSTKESSNGNPRSTGKDALSALESIEVVDLHSENDPYETILDDYSSSDNYNSDGDDQNWSYDVSKLDIESREFNALPYDVQHEILKEKLELEEHRTWHGIKVSRDTSDDVFSRSQVDGVIGRSKIWRRLEEIRKLLLTTSTESGVLAHKIVSEDNTIYILQKVADVVDKKPEPPSKVESRDNAVDSPTKRLTSIALQRLQSYQSQEFDNIGGGGSASDSDSLSFSSGSECGSDQQENTGNIKSQNPLIPAEKATSVDLEPTVKIPEYPTSEIELDEALKSDRISDHVAKSDNDSDSRRSLEVAAIEPKGQDSPTDDEEQNKGHGEGKGEIERNETTIHDSPIKPGVVEQSLRPKVIHSEVSSGSNSDDDEDDIELIPVPSPVKPITQIAATKVISIAIDNFRDPLEIGASGDKPNGEELLGSVGSISESDEDVTDRRIPVIKEPESISVISGITAKDVASDRVVAAVAKSMLQTEATQIDSEVRRAAQTAAGISEEMFGEARELIELFGLPWVIAPMEAEAQCAQLELDGLTDGTITDDSDIFLFGGTTVYRRMCSRKKDAEFYTGSNINRVLGLDREKMIRLGQLLGCDYAFGIEGVGVVTAMEILAEFPGQNGLDRFREWMEDNNVQTDSSYRRSLTTLKRKATLDERFPDRRVYQAFSNPQVDKNIEPFEWDDPDFDGLRKFALRRFGWSEAHTDRMLGPIIDRPNRAHQSTISEFFNVQAEPLEKQVGALGRSRLQSAVQTVKRIASYTSNAAADHQNSEEEIVSSPKKTSGFLVDNVIDVSNTSQQTVAAEVESPKRALVSQGQKAMKKRRTTAKSTLADNAKIEEPPIIRVLTEMELRSTTVRCLRSPAMVLLAAIVTRKAFPTDWASALTVGRAVADWFAAQKASYHGIKTWPKKIPNAVDPLLPYSFTFNLFGAPVRVVQLNQVKQKESNHVEGNMKEIRAIDAKTHVRIVPKGVSQYLQRSLGYDFDPMRQVYEALVSTMQVEDLRDGNIMYGIWERIRPQVPYGAAGWAKSGSMPLAPVLEERRMYIQAKGSA